MKNATKWFCVGALAATGVLAFACGGGNSESGGATTPTSASAVAPAASSATEATPTATTQATAAASSAAPAPMAPPLTVVAMKMTSPSMKHTIELKEDGTILGDGKPVAKLVGATIQDKDGKTLVSVMADNSVKVTGSQKEAKFNDKDELVIADGAKMFVGDDGLVKLFNPDGKADKDSGKIKLTGFKPTARRAATVFVLTMMLGAPGEPKETGASSVSAPSATPSAKPATKKP